MAERDYRALCGMDDVVVFSDEIFGFHVQQAVEKALKAWLSHLGVSYPKRHDLDELAALLEDAGQTIPAFACGTTHFPTWRPISTGAIASTGSPACCSTFDTSLGEAHPDPGGKRS